MLFREYELFYHYINNVELDKFTEAAIQANFTDTKFIEKMFTDFTKDRIAYLVNNKEGIMFDFFYEDMKR
jgi:hypothetical protein